VGFIVADIMSCDCAKVTRLNVGAVCGYCQYCDISILWYSDWGGVCVCVRSAKMCGLRWHRT
jgi:hypothetical protein